MQQPMTQMNPNMIQGMAPPQMMNPMQQIPLTQMPQPHMGMPSQMGPQMPGQLPMAIFIQNQQQTQQFLNQENCLYVGNLTPETTDDILYSYFMPFGKLDGCKVMMNTYTHQSRLFAFVTYHTKEDAVKAQQTMNGELICGREAKVYFKKNIRNYPPEANLVIRNLDKSVTSKQLLAEIKDFGPIVCCQVKREESGRNESLGYAYVQFEKKEDAEKFISEKNNWELNNKPMQIEIFKPYKQREHHNTNLYIKQFPENWNQEQVDKFIDEEFSKYGKITLKGVFLDKNQNKYYAFAAFETDKQASECMEKMNNYKFSDTTSLFVCPAMSKNARKQQLKKQRLQQNNRTNLYIKYLKSSVKEEDLRKAFEKFGKITSICLREWKSAPKLSEPQQVPPQLDQQGQPITPQMSEQKAYQFGFLNFDTQQEAENAYNNHKTDADVRALVDLESTNTNFMFFAQSKEVRNQYIQMQRKMMQGMRQTVMQYQPSMGRMRGPQINKQRYFKPAMPKMNVPGFQSQFMGNMPGVSQFPTGPQFQMQVPQVGMPGPVLQSVSNTESRSPMLSQGISTPPSAHSKKTTQTQENNEFTFLLTEKDTGKVADYLKDKKEEFMRLSDEGKKNILGSIMFKRIQNFQFSSEKPVQQEMFPKITGMLIDLEVLDFDEILEIFTDDRALGDRIYEAIDVITDNNNEDNASA